VVQYTFTHDTVSHLLVCSYQQFYSRYYTMPLIPPYINNYKQITMLEKQCGKSEAEPADTNDQISS
jgi:hypothetical protein